MREFYDMLEYLVPSLARQKNAAHGKGHNACIASIGGRGERNQVSPQAESGGISSTRKTPFFYTRPM